MRALAGIFILFTLILSIAIAAVRPAILYLENGKIMETGIITMKKDGLVLENGTTVLIKAIDKIKTTDKTLKQEPKKNFQHSWLRQMIPIMS